MRTEKELIQLLLDNIELTDSGICYLIVILCDKQEINEKEYWFLCRWIAKKMDLMGIKRDQHAWPKGELKPRIEWLKKEIEKL